MSGVTVICPNSRRCVVKVTPSTQLRKILEEACLRQGFEVDLHELKHQNRTLDLALPFRLSGLPNNATIEMTKVEHPVGPSQVEIALQLADGSRKLCKMSNDLNLLDVLEAFSREFGVDLIKCPGKAVPCCMYMNKQYCGAAELSTVTLKAMGIFGGRSLIRYASVEMSEDELVELEKNLASEAERKQKLLSEFSAKKAENERRQQLELQREKEYELELEKKREEEAAAKAAHEKAAESVAATAATAHQPSPQNRVVEASPSSELRTARNVESSSRLSHLESLLSHVNTSLDSNVLDPVTERWMTEGGRLTTDIFVHDGQQNEFANFKFPDAPVAAAPSDSEAALSNSSNGQPAHKCDRAAVMFTRSEELMNEDHHAAAEDENIDDKFFELNVNDAKSLQKYLRDQISSQECRALLPRAFVEQKNKELRAAAYKHTVIRFTLPDKNVIQARFLSNEPVIRLYEFITDCLQNKGTEFDLNFVLNQKIARDRNQNLLDVGLAPCSNIYLKFKDTCQDYASLFEKSALRKVTQAEADSDSKEWLFSNGVYRPYEPQVQGESRTSQAVFKRQANSVQDIEPPHSSASTSESPMPKWFRKQ